ncbi:ABC transporter substrate-binding protein [Brevibacterium album]|uniref:ABC transporter substrate-binding protein n=1 Tax=Brevibacterium album TaxID=417948 RepID=UPI000408DBAE|nr:ABC transporter substrate-binding protein [Brevibacterium album]
MNARTSRTISRAALAALAAGGLLLSGCGSGGGSGAGSGGGETADSLTVAMSYRASTLDPHAGSTYDPQYTGQIYDTLIAWDAEGKAVPGLATEWEFSDDSTVLTLTLREGVTFQDGEEMNAEAVKASLEHAMEEGSTIASDLATVESVETPDESTVVLNFSSPSTHILNALGAEAGMVISPASLTGDVGENPVGAGPYQVVSHSPDEVRLETWDGYWDAENVKTPNLTIRAVVDDSARVRALTSGEVDAGNFRPSQLAEIEAGGAKAEGGPTDLIYHVNLNTSVEGLDDPVVRRAVSQAIDRNAINENLQGGRCQPTAQPYIEGLPGHVEGMEEDEGLLYDPAAAEAGLEEAGFGASNPLNVTISSANISVYQELAQVLQDQLSQVGVESSVEAVDSAQAGASVRNSEYEVYVGPASTADPDATSYLAAYLLRDAPATEGYEVPEGAQLLTEARSVLPEEDGGAALQALVRAAYAEAAPIIPICAPDSVVGMGEGVEGFTTPVEGAYVWKTATVTK